MHIVVIKTKNTFHTKIQIKLISDIQDNKYNVEPLRFNRINLSSYTWNFVEPHKARISYTAAYYNGIDPVRE